MCRITRFWMPAFPLWGVNGTQGNRKEVLPDELPGGAGKRIGQVDLSETCTGG